VLNLWRYGNPVAPFIAGASGTPLTEGVVREFMNGYGVSRNIVSFLLAPLWIFADPNRFCGRGELYDPLTYVGLLGLFVARARRTNGALFFMAAVLYCGWFVSLQNARLLLPAVVFLAPAAADRLIPLARSRTWLKVLAGIVATVSLGIVASVGVLRAWRYERDPSGFLLTETQDYADVLWMNSHLDKHRDRVATDRKVLGYLEIPSILLDPTYQIEISDSELQDPERLVEALRRQRVTYLFGGVDDFAAIRGSIRVVYQNPSSRLGGVRFFRAPPSIPTAVFELSTQFPKTP
jgi:hypothetical protein